MKTSLACSLGLILVSISTLHAGGVVTNTPPSFTIGAAVIVLEDAGPQVISNWAINISPSTPPGNPDEAFQTVQFLVSNDNPSLFSAQPAIAPDGTLSFTPVPNACASANVTVVARDNGGTGIGGSDTSAPQSSTITVTCLLDPPTINCPTNLIVECTGGLTPVNFTVTASDEDGPVPVTCVPSSGSGFRLGTTNVTCTAANSAGSSSCSFTVTVVDTTPPRVRCPSNIVAAATGPSGAVVTYIAAASDPCGIASFDCSPLSGSTFPVGATTVTCTATDGTGNSNSCSFTVTVTAPNQCPTAVATVSPTASIECVGLSNVVIAANNTEACVVLDGSSSSDPDGDTLTYSWTVDGQFNASLDPSQEPGGGGTGSGSGTVTLSGNTLTINVTFSGLSANSTAAHIHGPATPGVNAAVLYPLNAITTLGGTAGTMNGTVTLIDGTGGFTLAQQLQQLRDGRWYVNIHTTAHPGGEIRGQLEATVQGALATSCLPLGSHEICLTVSDGQCSDTTCVTVEVVSPCQAVGALIDQVDGSSLPRNRQRPLVATLKAACASFESGRLTPGVNQLQAFQNKVSAQVAPSDPTLAQQLSDCAQGIIDALSGP